MGNEQKLENLKNIIKTSVTLSVQEKEEWLELVELMNDKQMSELMELLGQKPESATTPASAGLGVETTQGVEANKLEGQSISRLSHISNLPSSMGGELDTHGGFKSKQQTAASRILSSRGTDTGDDAVIKTKPATNLSQPGAELISKVKVPAIEPSKPITTVLPKVSSIKLELVQEASTLTPELFRREGVEVLTSALRNLAVTYGYFAVLDSFEDSPLYAAYLKAGQRIMTGQQGATSDDLSAQEFEMITDLMSSLRINRF